MAQALAQSTTLTGTWKWRTKLQVEECSLENVFTVFETKVSPENDMAKEFSALKLWGKVYSKANLLETI